MPILVACDELEPGMRLFEPIVSGERVMLQGGKSLTAGDIDVLKRRYPGLSVRVGDPILDDVIEFEDDARERDAASFAQQRISESMVQVQQRFSERASLQGVNFDAIHAAVAEILEYLRGHRNTVALLARSLDPANYLSTHAGNVFYLSMLLGSAVQTYVAAERQRQTLARGLRHDFASDLTPLGLGAIFIDLGMLPIQHVLTSDKPLSEADRQAVLKHPNVGADMLPENFSAVARMIVRTHHENFAGSGYPKGIVAEKLHVFSRIVRIADAYDAATSERVYRQAKSPGRVLWEMSNGPYRHAYDPELMAVFARLIQPFPIGAKLHLQDGRYAVVVRYNRHRPFLPTVVVAFDADSRPLPQADMEGPLCLEERPDLRVRSFRGEDLAYLYSEQPPETATREGFRTPIEAAFP